LAKDVNEAMRFLGEWTRISSGQEFFEGAHYVGSQACGGSGCHDQQVSEWRKTWHWMRPGWQDNPTGIAILHRQ
jgi:hypothetical protein